MKDTNRNRSARDILTAMDDKALFSYIPEMEISVPESDRRSSLDKIANYYREEQFTLSDLYIGYAVSLYRFTIPKVVASTIKVLGNLWPQKNVPKNLDREALLSRIKRMCGMGMLRRFVYQLNGNNIVLYSATPEFSKVIYQALKIHTDARPEKDMIPPIEVLGRAASSLISSELIKSPCLQSFNFMPEYRDSQGRISFNAEIVCEKEGEQFTTVVEPFFSRIDQKRFTAGEWDGYLEKKAGSLWAYMEHKEEKSHGRVQAVVVCEDLADFRKASTIICNVMPEYMLERVYYTAEGALKSADYDIRQSLVRVTSLRNGAESGQQVPESVSAQMAYSFF